MSRGILVMVVSGGSFSHSAGVVWSLLESLSYSLLIISLLFSLSTWLMVVYTSNSYKTNRKTAFRNLVIFGVVYSLIVLLGNLVLSTLSIIFNTEFWYLLSNFFLQGSYIVLMIILGLSLFWVSKIKAKGKAKKIVWFSIILNHRYV
eukprot:TRINITY_DN788_c0_g1_i6.p1 TRINITY_DN788_c0_g1~~TRINITY_DN788_c0_g1_i6.p1  ORF type:complete len:147 (+),score=20.18 TRINITY_DN788_c0_g1_i6:492-932(+)